MLYIVKKLSRPMNLTKIHGGPGHRWVTAD